MTRMDILRLDTERTWISRLFPLGAKCFSARVISYMSHGFIIRLCSMDTHLSHGIRVRYWLGMHLITPVTYRWAWIESKHRICQLYELELETEEHYVRRCTIYYDI